MWDLKGFVNSRGLTQKCCRINTTDFTTALKTGRKVSTLRVLWGFTRKSKTDEVLVANTLFQCNYFLFLSVCEHSVFVLRTIKTQRGKKKVRKTNRTEAQSVGCLK